MYVLYLSYYDIIFNNNLFVAMTFFLLLLVLTILVKALLFRAILISLICFFRGGRVCSAVHFRLCKDFLVVGLVSIFF